MVFGIVGLLFILGALGFVYALCKIAAQSDVIIAAQWAAKHGKE